MGRENKDNKMQKHSQVFFCQNCVLPRTSLKHMVRITKDGYIIVRDTCKVCKSTQEIESMDERIVDKFRIKSDEDSDKNESNK